MHFAGGYIQFLHILFNTCRKEKIPPEGLSGGIYYIRLYGKTVVTFVAIQTQLLIAGKTNPVGTGGFTAAVADIGSEDSRGFRQRDGGFLDIEHISGIAGLIIGEGFFTGQMTGLGFQHQSHGGAGFAIVERECLLAPHMEQQISLADAAAQHHLNGKNFLLPSL